jgi:hypothetical protein
MSLSSTFGRIVFDGNGKEKMLHKRLVYVAYFHATEVVLLLKLGGNEVFFDINRQKNLWVFHNTHRDDTRMPSCRHVGAVSKGDALPPPSVSRKAHPVVIARRNDEAIRLLSVISGLLHSVRNDEIGLSRQPQGECF